MDGDVVTRATGDGSEVEETVTTLETAKSSVKGTWFFSDYSSSAFKLA